MRDERAPVWGPYREVHRGRERWRLVMLGPTGKKHHLRYQTRASAERQKRLITEQLAERTVGDAVDAYEVMRRDRGDSPKSLTTTINRFKAWFPKRDRILATLKSKDVQAAKERRAQSIAVATLRGEACEVRAWFAWCLEQRWLDSNPAEGLKVEGKAKRGKPQLRLTEARAFQAAALARGDEGAVCALICLRAVARSEEARGLTVRDVEALDGGALIWFDPEVRRLKSDSAQRQRKISAGPVADLVLAHAEHCRREGQTWLFPSRGNGCKLPYHDASWLRTVVRSICTDAKVRVVTPQGLRATGATLATLAGQTIDVVQAALGHESPAITRSAYVQAGSEDAAKAVALSKVLDGNP